MSFLTIATSLIAPVAGFFTKRNENKTKIKIENIERIKNADDSLAEWEKIQAENSNFSWKDEFWTLILSIPLVLCFIPECVPFIVKGFAALEAMPTFYQYWLGVAILTSFGLKFTKR